MAEIQSLGIGSGVLNSELVDQLIAVEREAADFRLDQKEAITEAKISALGDLGSLVAELESAARSVSGVSSLSAKIANSSNETAITGTASSLATQGSWAINVSSLAQSQSIASTAFESGDASLGTGTLRFNFGALDYTAGSNFDFTPDAEQSGFEITIDSSNNSLSGIATTINQASIGINASVIDTGDGVKLVLASSDTGEQKAFTLTVDSADAQLNALAFNETRFSGDGLDTELLQAATSAEFTVNGLAVKRDTNLVIDVIDGLTLNLKETTTSAVNVSVAADVDTIADRIQNFVESYNGLREGISVATGYDPDTNQGSVFTGDPTLRLLNDRIRGLLNQSITLISNGSFSSLTEIGIEITDWRTGQLSFTRSTFESKIALYPDDIDALFGSDGRTNTDDIKFLSAPSTVTPGSYEVVVTQAATSGVYEGRATGSATFTINDTNDDLTVTVDGVSSGALKLIQGVYTGDELASELANRINASSSLQSASNSVAVNFDATNQSFSITSGSKGSSSRVEIASADAGLVNSVGLVPQNLGGFATTSVADLAVSDTFETAIVIDSTNNDISITASDITSTVSIAEGTYTSLSQLSSALQTAFSTDSNLVAAGISATVSGSASTEASSLSINLSQFGSAIGWQINSLEGDSGTLLGLAGGGYNGTPADALAVTGELQTGVSGTLDFVLSVDGTDSNPLSIAVSGTDADQMAADIQAAINGDANLAGASTSAVSSATFGISATPSDFVTNPRAFTLNYSGTDYQILVNSDAVVNTADGTVDDVAEIQAAIDAQIGGGLINAIVDGDSFKLETTATGPAASFAIVADGNSVKTDSGANQPVTGVAVDYSGVSTDVLSINYANLNIEVALGEAAEGYVSGGGLAASGFVAGADVQAYVQQQLDYALEQSGLQAGDLRVNLDAGLLDIESVSVNGVSNQFSQGSAAQITIASKTDTPDIFAAAGDYVADAASLGLDGFGFAVGTYQGTSANAVSVTFEGDENGGRFVVDGGGYQAYQLSALSVYASSTLGFTEGAQGTQANTGLDVQGTIGGEPATGVGSILTGTTGNTEGLRISALADTAGVAGRVTWITGVAKQIADFIDGFTATGSGLSVKSARLAEQLTEVQEDRDELNIRMAAREALLVAQFTYADSLVATINTTSDFLSRQLSILESIVAPRKDS